MFQQQQDRLDKKMQDPKFALKQNLLYGSYMQECLREDAGMRSTRALSETPSEFRSYHKGHRERNENRNHSQVSAEARNKLLYTSNFSIA